MTRISSRIASVLAVCMLLVGGSAYAQSPATTVYDPETGVSDVVSPTPTPTATPGDGDVAGDSDTSDPDAGEVAASGSGNDGGAAGAETRADASAPGSEAPVAPSGGFTKANAETLPFTGFEVGFIALAGAALLAGGVAMRRAARA